MKTLFRELSADEISFIAGGDPGDIVVVGNPWGGWGGWGGGDGWGGGGGGYGTSGGSGGGDNPPPSDPPPPPPPPPATPPCDKADNVVGITAPDGAKYYVPEGTTAQHLNDIVNHFTAMARGDDSPYGLIGAHERVLAEFYDIYTNPQNAYFVDFKDWGTTRGPTGSESGGEIHYTSQATGGDIVASPFEAFGNFFYGFLGTMGNISPEELDFAAAYLQEGNSGGFHDAPEDQPHVSFGIQQAMSYKAAPHGVFGIENGSCATGVTGSGTVG